MLTKDTDGPSPSSFYDQVISQSSNLPTATTMYSSGTTYYLAVEANPGGNCNPGSDVYIVKWAAGSAPVLSRLATLKSNDCIQADIVIPSKFGLAISILNADDLKVVNWQYDGATNALANQVPQTYHPQPGFIPLVSDDTPVVKSVVTRYGKLELNPNSGILLNGALQNFPGNPAIDYQGFASKIFQDGDKDEVIALQEPDNATGLVFQILTITPNNINLSKLFGAGYSYLSYKVDGANTLLNVGEYAANLSDTIMAPEFSDQHFKLSNGALTGLDTDTVDRIIPSDSLPANISIVSGTWYVATNADECVVAPYSPADMIDRDKANALQDDVQILLSDNQGTPMIVRVGEPKSGGLEEASLFFRGDLYCVQYKTKQDSQINQLQ